MESVIEDIAAMPLGYPDAVLSLDKDEIKSLRHGYFKYLDRYAGRRSDAIIVDKFPLNIIHTGLIYSLFPEAKIILALRQPCDVCLSMFHAALQGQCGNGKFLQY
jgi:hypothetical protein